MKYFVSSDIHSFYNEYKTALDSRGFDINNNEHIIVICGDLFDRGEQHQEIINFILSLPKERTILITGNHEDLLDTLIERSYPLQHDVSNGTYATLMELCHLPYRSFETLQVKELLEQTGYYKVRERMVNYYELDNYIFVHGWIPTITNNLTDKIIYNPDWRNASDEEWKDSRWVNGMRLWSEGILEPNKTIVCGHWNCSYGWSHIKHEREEFPDKSSDDFLASFEPFIDNGIIAIDACTAYSGISNVYVINK